MSVTRDKYAATDGKQRSNVHIERSPCIACCTTHPTYVHLDACLASGHHDTPTAIHRTATDRPRADPLPPLQLPRAPARQPNRCINSTRSNNTCDAGGLVLGKHYVAMSHRYTNHMLLSQCVTTASTADFTAATCQFIHYIVQHRYPLWHWTEPCHTDIHSPCNSQSTLYVRIIITRGQSNLT